MNILTTIQVIASLLLIVAILLQNRSSDGIGASFGGSGGGGDAYYTRRGFEKFLMQFTVIMATVFIVVAILQFVV